MMNVFFGCEPFVRPDLPNKPDLPQWQKDLAKDLWWYDIMKNDKEIPIFP